VPPQPLDWFRNVVTCLGDRLKIRVASKAGRPIASIITLRHGRTTVYKYGGSDASAHNLGAMPFLFWKAIEDAKNDGAQKFDFGRSDCDNAGLITFKDRWGSQRTALTYWRMPGRGARGSDQWRLKLPVRFSHACRIYFWRQVGESSTASWLAGAARSV